MQQRNGENSMSHTALLAGKKVRVKFETIYIIYYSDIRLGRSDRTRYEKPYTTQVTTSAKRIEPLSQFAIFAAQQFFFNFLKHFVIVTFYRNRIRLRFPTRRCVHSCFFYFYCSICYPLPYLIKIILKSISIQKHIQSKSF